MTPMRLYVLRVADTAGNRMHTHWAKRIGEFVYWRKAAEEDFGPAFDSWDTSSDIADAKIFTKRADVDKAHKDIANFDAVVVMYVLT